MTVITSPSPWNLALCTFSLAAMLMVGCETGQIPESTTSPLPASKTSPAGRQSMERRQSDVERFQEMNQVKVENKISPYRYVISTERFSIFGQLVQASSHSRTIHNGDVTLLCPTDDAFDNFDNWKMMRRRGNQQDIDDFVANHVIPITMTYDDFKSKDQHVTLAGTAIEVSTRGGISANGAHVRSGHVTTENGSVIGLDDVVFIPLALR